MDDDIAGLAAGVTEAVAVVSPMEVVKIRLQAQHHSMADPLEIPKYRNAAHALYTVVREEGVGALYRGVSLTALRQGSNQAGVYMYSTITFPIPFLRSEQPDLKSRKDSKITDETNRNWDDQKSTSRPIADSRNSYKMSMEMTRNFLHIRPWSSG